MHLWYGRSARGWFASDGLTHMSDKCGQGCWALSSLSKWLICPSSKAGSKEGKLQCTNQACAHIPFVGVSLGKAKQWSGPEST